MTRDNRMNADEIRSKLDTLRTLDRTRKVFGAKSHDYKVNPTISSDELEAFERSHGIRLPDDYRWFLLHIGNGGAGPSYGLFPLGVFPDNCHCGNLSRSFPHSNLWNMPKTWFETIPSPWGSRGAELAQQSWSSAKAFREALFALPKDDAAVQKRKEMRTWYHSTLHVDGALPVCHEGCGYYDLLIVTGPETGNIWIDGRASDYGIRPLGTPDIPRKSFSTWYADWLSECLKQHS